MFLESLVEKIPVADLKRRDLLEGPILIPDLGITEGLAIPRLRSLRDVVQIIHFSGAMKAGTRANSPEPSNQVFSVRARASRTLDLSREGVNGFPRK